MVWATVRGRLLARLSRLINNLATLEPAERFAAHLAIEFAAVFAFRRGADTKAGASQRRAGRPAHGTSFRPTPPAAARRLIMATTTRLVNVRPRSASCHPGGGLVAAPTTGAASGPSGYRVWNGVVLGAVVVGGGAERRALTAASTPSC